MIGRFGDSEEEVSRDTGDASELNFGGGARMNQQEVGEKNTSSSSVLETVCRTQSCSSFVGEAQAGGRSGKWSVKSVLCRLWVWGFPVMCVSCFAWGLARGGRGQ